MQDNFDKAFRDKLAGYQAPADPMDWAAMSAALDAQESKRRGFFWWWVLGLGLIAATGTISYHFWSGGNNANGEAHAIAGEAAAQDNETTETATGTNPGSTNNGVAATDATGSNATNAKDVAGGTDGLAGEQNNQGGSDYNKGNGGVSTGLDGNASGIASNTVDGGSKQTKNSKRSKKGKGNSTVGIAAESNASNTGNGSPYQGKPGTGNAKGGAATNTPSSVDGAYVANGADAGQGDEDLSATINIKQLKQLPNTVELTFKKDSSDISYKMLKPKAFSHSLGFGAGWLISRVDRSGDFRPGYNVGMQYGLMYKNRVGLNVGLAFRQYNYFTDLVACNYEIYQCPTSYSSEVRTIDLNVGLQVNLVHTEKVDWYVMGGVNNQFMLQETFDYSLPVVDTPSVPNLPVEPPRNTSFTGGGSSDFSESISESQDFLTTGTTGTPAGEGKFLRERFIGGWYVGTGVTYRFVPRMSLQVEPVFGRTSQFVGIQDKKLWNTGVNVRLNVRLGK